VSTGPTVNIDLSHYKVVADNLIRYSLAQDPFQRNLLITSAYAHLFLTNPNAYRWAGLAAHTSEEIGLLILATQTFLKTGSWTVSVSPAEQLILNPFIELLKAYDSSEIQPLHNALVLGNLRLYEDAVPLFLAYQEGGISEVTFLQNSKQLFYSSATPEANQLKMSWAIAVQNGDYQGAFVDYARFEQFYFLQDLIYTPQYNVLSVLSAPGSLCYSDNIPSDCDYFSLQQGAEADIANDNDRWSWVANHIAPSWEAHVNGNLSAVIAWEQAHVQGSQGNLICGCFHGDSDYCGAPLFDPTQGHPLNCVMPWYITATDIYNCSSGHWSYKRSCGSIGCSYNPAGPDVCNNKIPLPPSPTGCGLIAGGQGLAPGAETFSCDQRFRFIMQNDGNLMLYEGSRALWGAGTNGKGGYVANMQTDGNLVVYDSAGRPLWASNTAGHGGSNLLVQNDGNVVIYDRGGHPLWATNTVQPPPTPTCSQAEMSASFYNGRSYWTCDLNGDGGRYFCDSNGRKTSQACPNDICISKPIGTDDRCGSTCPHCQ
jgi:Protein of unknown function (DUF2515)